MRPFDTTACPRLVGRISLSMVPRCHLPPKLYITGRYLIILFFRLADICSKFAQILSCKTQQVCGAMVRRIRNDSLYQPSKSVFKCSCERVWYLHGCHCLLKTVLSGRIGRSCRILIKTFFVEARGVEPRASLFRALLRRDCNLNSCTAVSTRTSVCFGQLISLDKGHLRYRHYNKLCDSFAHVIGVWNAICR